MPTTEACGCTWDGPVQTLSCHEHNAAAKNVDRAQVMLIEKELELERYRQALDKFGIHVGDCVDNPCICGLSEMLEKPKTLNLNGREIKIYGRKLSYEVICALASGVNGGISVTWTEGKGNARISGTLMRGQNLRVTSGMKINAMYTGNA